MQLILREKSPGHNSRMLPWLYVAVMMALIILSLPLTPFLWERAVSLIGTGFNSIAYIMSFVLAALLLLILMPRWRQHGFIRLLALVCIGFVYGYFMRYYCKFPAEKLHLLEYGFLAFLVFRAFRVDFSRTVSIGMAFLCSSAFGLLDEVIQYILPNRNFEVRDVITNIAASALGVMLIYLFAQPDPPRVMLERRK